MVKISTVITLFVTIGLMACDPVHSIVIKNTSQHPTRVSYVRVIRSERFATEVQSRIFNDSATIILAPRGKKRYKSFFYGIGAWGDQSIADAAKEFKKLKIASASDTLELVEYEQIRDFFTARKRGLLSSTIMIKIK